MDEAVTDEAVLLQEALREHRDALAFCSIVQEGLHFLDDVADGDRQLSARDVEQAAWTLLVALPRNRFYAAHFAELNPIMASAITHWALANQLEEAGEAGPASFILRSSYIDLVTHTLLLCLGWRAAIPYIREVRRTCHGEGLDGYLANLAKQFETARRSK